METPIIEYKKFKTFGDLKPGDFIYGIANEPFAGKVEACEIKEGKAHVVCPSVFPHGALILEAKVHAKQINPALSITSDRTSFQEAIRPNIEPRLAAMKEKVKLYEELLAEDVTKS